MTKAQMNYSIGYTMHLRNNTLLQGGKYKIVRFIASGGFGCTYEAHHTLLDSRVALKEFFVGDFCNRDEATGQVTIATKSKEQLVGKLKKKFMDEARALFKMKHPGIVRVIDIFEENGTAYYAMEYIEGQSLSDVVKKRGKLPEAEAVGYIRQVAEALKYVHSLNRLHLDIKPGNIMLNKEGKAILIDFGASKHYDDETGENTSTLLGINTKGYAPVEQMNQSFRSFSPATDIYALGATLYKLLTGITPPLSTLLNSEEATLAPLPSCISPSIRYAVESAMQLLRKNRPQSVNTFLSLLSDQDESTNIIETIEIKDLVLQENTEEEKTYLLDKISSLLRTPFPWVKFFICFFVISLIILVLIIQGGKQSPEPDNLQDNITEISNNVDTIVKDEIKRITAINKINGHEYVDLGLSVKWATMNIGANKPSEYGNYYAWGEITKKSEYTRKNSKMYKTEISEISGNKKYDAARAIWGGTWRIPTKKEINELINKCKTEWKLQDDNFGLLITGPNGNSIFLPAGGCAYLKKSTADSYCNFGYYSCSTSIGNSFQYSYYLHISEKGLKVDWHNRFVGFSVRPVSF